ncbi:MAG TPA: DUF3710 domain-containing protein [Intrasporangium sp.]|uniref:DUF3710 domain-containing protein n=1 Tax=Intrasporangium sp. TaxID=1925024 RepID=UPI002D799B6B|nr:DUF3710 domain-containing protein [Intrasporangium sp.]HET7397374.1 DUF3710 domain-containing protein [Intrasporangium sp.]
MGLFSRGRDKRRQESPAEADRASGPDETDEVAETGVAGADVADPHTRTSVGPLDRSALAEADADDYLVLGSLWVKGQAGMELRLELNEQEQQITGVTAIVGESAVQLQAFAAPRTEGVWVEIRNEIAESITDAGGTAEVVTGDFGEELQTRMPQAGADGRTVFMPARFVGIDGPRWFLRAVISGRAAIDPAAAEPIVELIRSTVVDRGDEAMPPRELLPLRLPEQPAAETSPDAEAPEGQARRAEELKPFERGPEITEVR